MEALQQALLEARHLEAIDCTLKNPELVTSVDAGLRASLKPGGEPDRYASKR